MLLNKPIGFVSGQAEQGYRPAITLITAQAHFKGDRSPLRFVPSHLKGLAPAGRLDIDSTGLLVLTQDGRIAKQLIGGDSGIDKEYLVRVEGRLPAAGLAQLNFGLSLDGVPLKRAEVKWQNDDQLRFVLREGKKRQIRRMCELVGLKVTGFEARLRIRQKFCSAYLTQGQYRRYLAQRARISERLDPRLIAGRRPRVKRAVMRTARVERWGGLRGLNP